jgi:hypothetical protein
VQVCRWNKSDVWQSVVANPDPEAKSRGTVQCRIMHLTWHQDQDLPLTSTFRKAEENQEFRIGYLSITRIWSKTADDVTVTFDSPVLFNPELLHHMDSGPHLTLSFILSTPTYVHSNCKTTFVYVPTKSIHGIPSFLTPYNSRDHSSFRGSNGLPFWFAPPWGQYFNPSVKSDPRWLLSQMNSHS